jgi:hypothetical protein
MFKVMNIVFGVCLAVVLFLLAITGIQAFIPEPDMAWEACGVGRSIPVSPEKTELSIEEQQKQQQEESQRNDCYAQNKKIMDDYDYQVFIIASILAGIFIIASYFLLTYIHIAAGVVSAGIALIFYAFTKGWDASGPKSRFFVGLILAIIVFIFSYLTANRIKK